jgi:deoxycytidylate deaminase
MKAKYIQLGMLAYAAALRGAELKHYLVGAAAIRRDGAVVSASNGPAPFPCPYAHAEVRLCQKLDRGAIVHVVRRRRDGTLGCSKPCRNCERTLWLQGVSKVYYTEADGSVRRLW